MMKLLAAVLLLASVPQEPAQKRDREQVEELRRQALQRKNLERVPQEADVPVTGEVPEDLLDEVLADLEERIDGSRPDFEVRRGEAVPWPDGSLGCPEPGQDYQHAPMKGYWIVIVHGDTEYDYRASERGFFKLCESPKLERNK